MLPADVLAHIFTAVGAKGLAMASCVCRLWREVASADQFWRQAYVTEFGFTYPHSVVAAHSVVAVTNNGLSPFDINSEGSGSISPNLPSGICSWRHLFIKACDSRHRPYLCLAGRINYAMDQLAAWRLLVRAIEGGGTRGVLGTEDTWQAFPARSITKGVQSIRLTFCLPGEVLTQYEGLGTLYDVIVQAKTVSHPRGGCLGNWSPLDLELYRLVEDEEIYGDDWFSVMEVPEYELISDDFRDSWRRKQVTGLSASRVPSENLNSTSNLQHPALEVIADLHAQQLFRALPFPLIQSLTPCGHLALEAGTSSKLSEGTSEFGTETDDLQATETLAEISSLASSSAAATCLTNSISHGECGYLSRAGVEGLPAYVYVDFTAGGSMIGSCCAALWPRLAGSTSAFVDLRAKCQWDGPVEGITTGMTLAELVERGHSADITLFTSHGQLVLGRAGTGLQEAEGEGGPHTHLYFIPEGSSDGTTSNSVSLWPSRHPRKSASDLEALESTSGRLDSARDFVVAEMGGTIGLHLTEDARRRLSLL